MYMCTQYIHISYNIIPGGGPEGPEGAAPEGPPISLSLSIYIYICIRIYVYIYIYTRIGTPHTPAPNIWQAGASTRT